MTHNTPKTLNINNRPPPSFNKSDVYSIPCNDCSKFYIGDTGKDLNNKIQYSIKKFILEMKETSGKAHL